MGLLDQKQLFHTNAQTNIVDDYELETDLGMEIPNRAVAVVAVNYERISILSKLELHQSYRIIIRTVDKPGDVKTKITNSGYWDEYAQREGERSNVSMVTVSVTSIGDTKVI